MTEIYHSCRNRWGYGVPATVAEQAHLRSLCHDVLAYEKHFLSVYRDYLLEELQHPGVAVVRLTIQRLGQLIHPDREVTRALRQVQQRADADLATAIDESLTAYRNVEQ